VKQTDVIWSTNLQPEEYPDGVLDYMAAQHCRNVVALRGVSGVPFSPGPYFDNFVRFKKLGSRHNVGPDKNASQRESDAGDYFILNEAHVCQLLKYAPELFGGVGVYFDTKPAVMFHLDNRSAPVKWLRVAGEYIYYNADPVRYYTVLAAELAKLPKQKTW
jgi:hypothetical protein